MGSFDELMVALDQTMVIVTVTADGESGGCLVGFHGQASIDPPRYVVMLSEKNRTTRLAADAGHLGVHAIDAAQLDLASAFGERTGDEVDKLAGIGWHVGPHGTPIIDRLTGWFVGEVLERVRVGDHIAHVLQAVEAKSPPPDFHPLKFQQVEHFDPGHQP